MRLIVLLSLLLAPCSHAWARDRETKYQDKLYHYSLILPATWKQADTAVASRAGVSAAFLSPVHEHHSGTITVQVATCPDLSSMSAKCLRDIQAQGTLLAQHEMKLGEVPGREFIWSAAPKGKSVRYVSAIFVLDGKGYTLNAVCPASQWNANVMCFRRAAATFKYLP